MKNISYIPSKDELLAKFGPIKGRPTKEFGPFRFWWDDRGNIRAVGIMPYTPALQEFRKNLKTVRLSGVWKGVKITEEDIKEARDDLLKKLEENW